MYGLEGNSWTKMTDMKTGRSDHGCDVLGQKLFIVFNGAVEVYDMSLGTWTEAGNVEGEGGHVISYHGRLYSFEGDYGIMETFSEDEGDWTKLGKIEFKVSDYYKPFSPAIMVTRQMLNC